MEISGEIIAVLPLVEGQGKNGPWFKQEYILEIPSQYPKKVCFSLWGNKIDEYNLLAGQKVTAHIDIESRDYNSRWYTEVKCWKIEKEAVTRSSATNNTKSAPLPPVTTFTEESDDDIPF